MRLVDADQMALDESEAYMSAQERIADDLTWLVNFGTHSKIQRIIADTPTVDAVPVVRCRDCKHSRAMNPREEKIYLYVCKVCENPDASQDGYMVVMPDHFCSYGERKEENNDTDRVTGKARKADR